MGDVVELLSPAETVRAKLQKLADYLNAAYGVELALVCPDRRTAGPDETPCLVVHRGLRVDDVVAAVSLADPVELGFNVAVFTCTAWFEYGDPFVTSEQPTVRSTTQYLSHYVPFHPAT